MLDLIALNPSRWKVRSIKIISLLSLESSVYWQNLMSYITELMHYGSLTLFACCPMISQYLLVCFLTGRTQIFITLFTMSSGKLILRIIKFLTYFDGSTIRPELSYNKVNHLTNHQIVFTAFLSLVLGKKIMQRVQ